MKSGDDIFPGFDARRLEIWMRDNVPGFDGPIRLEKFAGGQSNPTYRVSTPGTDYVLRRKPPGKLLPGAHAVERERRIIAALENLGFQVPHSYGLCEDDRVVGTTFFVMECVEGRIFWDPTLPEVPRKQRMEIYRSMCAVVAELHSIDYEEAGLADYGKPGNFFARQISRWSRQYQLEEAAGRIEAMDRLCAWLPENIPDGDETAICHGDFRCDNLIVHPTEPRILAVLDWELLTLGNPLADFTYHLMAYRTPADLPAGMAGRDPLSLGLPSEDEYVAMYCRHTDRDGIPQLDFYFGFNLFRLVSTVHGIKGRLVRGNASSDRAEELVGHLERLAAAAREQAVRAGAD